jgi:hypothetical protein
MMFGVLFLGVRGSDNRDKLKRYYYACIHENEKQMHPYQKMSRPSIGDRQDLLTYCTVYGYMREKLSIKRNSTF